ncbi:hypothetical protein C0030_002895 [Candidatus Liberibacter solanacearum]|uniref:Uncharacterized protein n=1 Tax=Candidatus Liberibacter solanacearum TaxID=556287 RepID=A0A3R7R9D8_9HYPH|nr:hypothetical protein C0030_002895 [Candidatus Liberibacter solanacearum]
MQDKKWITGKDGQVNNLLRLATQFLVMPVSWARMHLIDIPNNMVGGGLGLSANVYRAKALVIGILGEELIRNTLIPLISGKDPRFDFSDPWEYAKALLNGVLHYERFSPVGKQSGWDILGPALGQAGRLGGAAYDAYTEKNRRKKGKAQAGLMKEVLNSTVPFQNMWYTKAAFDHFVREELDDAINPGGRKRAEAYRRKKIQRDKRN